MGIESISKEVRDLIDVQLLQISKLNATLGRDSRVDERIECRRAINVCLKEIKKLDAEFYREICPNVEKD